MALTIGTTPLSTFCPVNNKVQFILTSNRLAATARNNSGLADNGSSKCRYTYAAPHTFQSGDIILGSSFSNAALNVLQTVTYVNSTTIDTDLSYVAGYSGLTGTHTRSNYNFQVKAEIIVAAVTIGTIAKRSVSISGTDSFRFDVSEILQGIPLTFDIATLGAANITTPATSNAIKAFTVKFTEQFDDVNGLLSNGGDITSSTYYAINACKQMNPTDDIDNYVCDGVAKHFLTAAPVTQRIRVGEEIQFSFLTNIASHRIWYRTYNLAGVAGSETYTTLVSINNKHGIISINSNFFNATHSKIEFRLSHGSTPGTHYSEVITLMIEPACDADRLFFLNRFGGFDAFSFVADKEISQKIERETYLIDSDYSINSSVPRSETNLFVSSENIVSRLSDRLTDNEVSMLEDLYDSPEVILISGSTFIPVTIVNTEALNKRGDDLVSSEVQYTRANKKIRQW